MRSTYYEILPFCAALDDALIFNNINSIVRQKCWRAAGWLFSYTLNLLIIGGGGNDANNNPC